MSELGFIRNEPARQLRVGTSRTFAYVTLDAYNPFFTDVAQGIEDAIEGADLSLFLCNSNGRISREQSYLERLQQQRVHGILITPIDAESPQLDGIVARGIPIVIVDRTRKRPNLCSVSVDDELGGSLAVEHLVELGHKRVAFVGPESVVQVRDRLRGAQDAWRGADLSPEDLVHRPTDAMTIAEGAASADRLLDIGSRHRPTAAFCANDLIALGLLQRALARGLRIPEDLAIVGYDDIYFASAAAVPLTSVRQPRFELGRAAARLLLEAAANPEHRHRKVVFKPELVTRASSVR